MDVYNDAFWRWKELKCQSGCFSAPPGGPPRELWLWEIGVGMGRDWRGNGQLQLNVTFIGPSVGFIPSRPDRSRPSGLTFRGCTFRAQHRAVKAAKEVSWQAEPGRAQSRPGRQQDGVWYATLIHGNAAALPLWLLLHWANTPNCSLPAGLFSPPAHCLCPHISFMVQERGDRCESHWANSGERRLPSLPCSQENLPFYFFIWAPSCRTEPRVWCQKAELIALSQRGLATHHQTGPEMFYWRLLKLSLDNTDKYWATKSLQLCFHSFIDGLKCPRQKGAA